MSITELDISSLFTLTNLIVIILGSFIGMLFGAVPGLGAMITIVLLLPVSFMLSPLAAILLLLSAYQSAEYGGSISAITLGIPGTPAAAATAIDGSLYARNHSPGKAIAYSLTASTIGGLFGGLVLIFLAVPLTNVALNMAAAEYALIGVLGLFAVAALTSKNITKSLISAVLGLLVATIGYDMFTGVERFTSGRMELIEGVGAIALIVGVFGFAELFTMISNSLHKTYVTDNRKLKSKLSFKELKDVSKPMGAGSIVGSIVGIFPGTGAGTSSFLAYSVGKNFAKNKKTYGKGNPAGIVAPEAANNATVGGGLLPLLTLGIPGSPTIAVIMGAFIIHGIQPGPTAFTSEPELMSGILAGFLLCTIVMYFMGRALTPLFSRILTIANSIIIPIILVLSMIGVFINKSMFFEIWLALGLGIIAFFLRKLDFSVPAFVLAFVLGPIIEQNLRRALSISGGSYDIFYTRPFAAILLIIIIAIIVIGVFRAVKGSKKTAA